MIRSAGVRRPYRSTFGSSVRQNTRPPFFLSPIRQPFLPFSTRTMSQTHTSASSSNFRSVFNTALEAYEKKTKSRLLTHPLAARLQSCNSPAAILSVLQDMIQQFDPHRRSDQRLTTWLNPTITVIYAFSAILGQGLILVSFNLSPS